MSRNYKFHNPDGIYFISFAVVSWLDVFTRRLYKDSLVETFRFCQENKGLIIFSWVIMTNHVHLIIKSDGSNKLPDIVRDLKKFSSKKLVKMFSENPKESRKKIFLEVFKNEGQRNCNNKKYQFWRQDNKPIEIWSNSVIQTKLNYIHNNPVKAGFVQRAEDYLYSSAVNYNGGSGVIEIEIL